MAPMSYKLHARTGSAAITLGLLVWASFAPQVVGNAFRGSTANALASPELSPEAKQALLGEIEDLLGSEHRRATEARLARIETAMKPTFNALPKNEYGRLGHAAVRYGMHRFFVQRHGWFVKGLEPKGESENISSPSIILKDRMSSDVQDIFEARLGKHGLDLHAMSVMAATLENQVHKEAMERLGHTYRGLERSLHDPLSVEESHEVIDTYMAIYILGANVSAFSPDRVRKMRKDIILKYPTWPDTQTFIREVQTTTSPNREELSYENVASVVEEIGERYGRWQHKECTALKNDLVAIEDHGSGRVRLSEFYRAAVQDGKWQFSENTQYLRGLGALDESDPSSPSVIIPNYINSPSNCVVASSAHYAVCCIDECEDILGHIEEMVGTPEATTGEILAIVAALPSATVMGGRTLPAALAKRLEEVATYHGGRIPLHGRLFAQWLHLAYPRECSYPHVAGATNQNMVPGAAPTAEMLKHIEAGQNSTVNAAPVDGTHVGDRMWTLEEELLVARTPASIPARQRSSLGGFIRFIVFAAVFVSFALVMKQNIGNMMSKKSLLLPKSQGKYV